MGNEVRYVLNRANSRALYCLIPADAKALAGKRTNGLTPLDKNRL